MKRIKRFFAVVCILGLVACGTPQVEENELSMDDMMPEYQEETTYEEPVYSFDSEVRSDCYVREDTGEEAAVYNYCVPVMKVDNEERLSEEDRAVAMRNVENFNERMNELMEEFENNGQQLLEEQRLLVETEDVSFVARDEMMADPVVKGEIVTVAAHCYYYGGGAHPIGYVVTYTYDLSVGQFIDPIQIADDPEQFRISAAEFLVQYAESLGEEYVSEFWQDYEEIIERWNETAVIFDETGMTVIFSVYELGPYFLGAVELCVSDDVLVDLIGSGGMARLGIS